MFAIASGNRLIDQTSPISGQDLRRPSGFTLIEILTVIAAISVMLSMIMLSMGSVGLRKANSLAKETSFLMRTMADEAIMTGRRYGLVVDHGQRSLRPVGLGGGGSGFEPIVWGADMQVVLRSTDLLNDYEGANFSAKQGNQDEQAGSTGPAVVFEPIGTWTSKGNTFVFIYDGQPVKRLTWTAIGRVKIENLVSETG